MRIAMGIYQIKWLRAELEKQVRLRVQTESERDNLAFDNQLYKQLYKQKVDELREQKANVHGEMRAELDAARAALRWMCDKFGGEMEDGPYDPPPPDIEPLIRAALDRVGKQPRSDRE